MSFDGVPKIRRKIFGLIMLRRSGKIAVRLNRRPSMALKGRRGSSPRPFLVSIFLLAFLAVGGYLFFVPNLIGRVPPSAPLTISSQTAVPPECVETPSKPATEQPPQACQEVMEAIGTTDPGDTLRSLFDAHVSDEAIAHKLATKLAKQIALEIGKSFGIDTPVSGRPYTITVDADGRFLRGILEYEPARVFHCRMTADGRIGVWKEDVVLEYRPEVVSFKISSSLNEAIHSRGEGGELATRLANVFQWDIDFQTETRKNDVCKVLFERKYSDDRPSGYGRILCAVYEGRKTGEKTAIFFKDRYYDLQGSVLQKDFLRSPLDTTLRVTSRYGMRIHPILKIRRKHEGVDYGAPSGTGVRSVARGVVVFAGWKNGYGKYVRIKHDNGYESRYGHLRSYRVRKGQRVEQRHKIGQVGMTGRATGPHLDFQMLKNGKHIDPDRMLRRKMVVSVPKVPTPLLPRFSRVKDKRLQQLTEALARRHGPLGPSLARLH